MRDRRLIPRRSGIELSRRSLLRTGFGTALTALGPAGRVLAALGAPEDRAIEVDPRFWTALPFERTQCFLCPLHCILNDGETCFCRTRTNHAGLLKVHAYANPCILTVDPIEKLPLHHFHPGESTLSIALGGCNLRCIYCQNWAQSQKKPKDLETFDYPPARAVDSVQRKEITTIAYTYTEPIAFYEYVRDVSALARQEGVRNVVATAAFVETEPLKALCPTIDAFVVSLKGFDEQFYEKVTGVSLKPVLKALETIVSEGTWLEILHLVVPGYNDDDATTRKMCQWIRRELGPKVPLHFARFVPEYRLADLPPTPVPTLERCRAIGLDAGLEHVYLTNVSPHEGNTTFCPRCDRPLVRRLGFRILENRLQGGRCPDCRTRIPGQWGPAS